MSLLDFQSCNTDILSITSRHAFINQLYETIINPEDTICASDLLLIYSFLVLLVGLFVAILLAIFETDEVNIFIIKLQIDLEATIKRYANKVFSSIINQFAQYFGYIKTDRKSLIASDNARELILVNAK